MAKLSERSGKAPEIPRDVPAPVVRAEATPRLSLPYDATRGVIDFASMRPVTRDRLRRALADPSARVVLTDTTTVPTGESDKAVAVMMVDLLYDAIGTIAVVVARTRGVSATRAEVLRYTAEEKKLFMEPTLKVFAKHQLLSGKYADEIALVLAVGSVTAAHVVAMNQQHDEEVVVFRTGAHADSSTPAS